MKDAKLKIGNNEISFILPLTQPTGKVRVKERNSFYEYGNPVAVRQTELSLKNYVEWQIGYDLLLNEDNRSKTTLSDKRFLNYKNEKKLPYELSEILYYSFKNNYITKNDIQNVYKEIQETKETIDILDEMQITRTNPIETKINNVDFYKMKVSYPLIVHKFGKYDIYAEIMNREKQRAVGVQPMLYVCLPITSLKYKEQPLGRILDSNECGEWVIGKEEARLSLELFRIFGMLTEKHKYDVSEILKILFDI